MEDKEKGIRLIYSPSDEQKEMIRFIYDRRRAMEDSEQRQKLIKNIDQWEKQWEGYREPKGADDWQSNHVVPMTLSVVETALSEIVKQNLKPFVRGRGLEDDMQGNLMQHIWDYAWDISDGDSVNYDALHDLLINGTVVAQEYYRKDKRKIGSVSMKGETEETSYHEVLDYDDVCTEIVKLQDFYKDEFGRDFDGPYAVRDCIRRYIMDIDDFHRMYDKSDWDQYGDAAKVKAGGEVDYYEFYRPPVSIDMSKRVEVLHYWNKPRDLFCIVANDVLIRNKPNPYKHKQLPFVRGVDIKRSHSFYGKGEPELLESIQDEANILRRMIIDRNHLDIDKMFAVSNRLGLSDEDLIARPHGMIPTDDPNGVKAIEYGDIPRSVELSLKHLEDDATISTGINPRAQALPTAGTATEAAILKESTLRRIETKIMLFKKLYLRRLGKLRVANILQFYPEPKLEKIAGDKNTEEYKKYVEKLQQTGSYKSVEGQDFQQQYRQIGIKDKAVTFDAMGKMTENPAKGWQFFQLKPDYFMPLGRGNYDLIFDAGANIEISKPLMQTKNLELFDRVIQIALSVPGSYDPVKLTDMILRDQDKNPDDLKPDLPPVDESQQRLEMQIQMASMENQQMIQGKPVPATPFAPPVHTRIHVEFMQSPTFQQAEDSGDLITNIFKDHVMGELMAQEARNIQGSGAPVEPDQMSMEQPGQQKGKGGKSSVSQGITNRPGGMAQPSNKPADILPSFNTGGNKNLP